MDAAPYPADDGSLDEILRALRIASLGVAREDPAVFRPGARVDFLAAWTAWIGGGWRQVHGPIFARSYLAARDGDLDALRAADAECDRLIRESSGSAAAERSIDAGSDVLASLPGAASLGVRSRVEQDHAAGSTPGHFAVALGAQAAAFHVPLIHALAAHAYLEWRWARRSRGESHSIERFAEDAESASLRDAIAAVLEDGFSDRQTLVACA